MSRITTKAAGPAQKRDRKQMAVRTAQILLAVIFLFTAFPKLVGVHASVQMFGQIGAGQWLRYFVGMAELAGAVGLLVPRLAGLAAAGLAADMVGASIINVVVLHSGAVVLTSLLCVVCVLVARKSLSTDAVPSCVVQAAAVKRPYLGPLRTRVVDPIRVHFKTQGEMP